MVEYLKVVIEQKGADMSVDERSLLSVAFKNLVSAKRTAWRTVVAVHANQKYATYASSIIEYKLKLEDALYEECSNIISLIQLNILKKKCSDDAKAFFTKLVADNHRYIAEMSVAERHQKALEDAR